MNLKELKKELKEEEIKLALVFVQHIRNHLATWPTEVRGRSRTKPEVMCKICDKTISQIYEEEAKEILGES